MELDIIETMRVKPKPVQQSQRAADWARVRTEYPDHAELITALGASFGKLASVRVSADSETLLDSKRYE